MLPPFKLRCLSTVCIVLRMIDTRDQQRAWLNAVLARTGLNATQLASKSGLAITTLTRFLNNPQHSSALSMRTISAIERETGIRYGENGPPAGFRETEAEPFTPGEQDPVAAVVDHLRTIANGMDPWVMKSRALESAGIQPGDILLVNLNRQPAAGDIVCAQVYDWTRGKAETVFRIWEPPYLVAATMEPKLRRPMIVDNEHILIKGVMEFSMRPRLGRTAAAA